MGGRMEATLGTLVALKTLSGGPASREHLLDAIEEEVGARKETRMLQRYLTVLREAGFEVRRKDGRYELLCSPARLLFDEYEALATLNVVESLAEREPVYGEHLSSAARKLREVLPERAVEFADSGRVDFDLAFASDPPEDPGILDVLRQAAHRSQKVEMHYYSLSSEGWGWRTVEPVNVSYAQQAHRLHAYDPDRGKVIELRVNRVSEARMLPDKFSPAAHRRRLEGFEVRLSRNAFIAYRKGLFHDPDAEITNLEDGGAIIKGRTPSTFWTVREIAALGPDAEVLGSPQLKEEFLQFLADIREIYP